jgi:DNA invertase Pin-like site-specific DNA recombinase
MNTTRRPSKPSNDNRVAVAYIRVSTEDQHLGPEAQRVAIATWAERQGVTVVATFEDRGVSGGAAIDRRPGLLAAVDALGAHGAGLLVVAKRDRLARDTMIAAMAERLAERAGGRIVSAAGEGEGDDPASKLMRTMIDAFAEYERALIKARTRSALAIKAARGEKVGGVQLYGAADGLDPARADIEREIVSRASKLRAAGMPIRDIAVDLNSHGLRTRRGGLIQPTQVARILGRAA